MTTCSYCGKQIQPGFGTRVFARDGSAVSYCSRKCDKYSSMGRKAKRLKWTVAGRE